MLGGKKNVVIKNKSTVTLYRLLDFDILTGTEGHISSKELALWTHKRIVAITGAENSFYSFIPNKSKNYCELR